MFCESSPSYWTVAKGLKIDSINFLSPGVDHELTVMHKAKLQLGKSIATLFTFEGIWL